MKVHQGCASTAGKVGTYCDTEYPATKKKYFIMPYLQPALLEGHKFDLRTYGLLASLDPLLVFYAGTVRTASYHKVFDGQSRGRICAYHQQRETERQGRSFLGFRKLTLICKRNTRSRPISCLKSFKNERSKSLNLSFKPQDRHSKRNEGGSNSLLLIGSRLSGRGPPPRGELKPSSRLGWLPWFRASISSDLERLDVIGDRDSNGVLVGDETQNQGNLRTAVTGSYV